jgi:hypothetical protein
VKEPKYGTALVIFNGDILSCDAVGTYRWTPMFRRKILPPSSGLNIKELPSFETLRSSYMSTRRQSLEYHCEYLHRIVNNTVLRRRQLVRPRRLYILAPRVHNPDGRQILQHRREKIKGLRWRQYVSPKRLYVNANY